jgi:hypothetical protein
MKYVNCNVLSASDASSQDGIVIESSQLFSASFQAYFGDDTAAGTVQIQASNDEFNAFYQPSVFTPTNWTNIPNASATVTAGASVLITLQYLSYRWMRAIYTSNSGGSTTVNVTMMALSL